MRRLEAGFNPLDHAEMPSSGMRLACGAHLAQTAVSLGAFYSHTEGACIRVLGGGALKCSRMYWASQLRVPSELMIPFMQLIDRCACCPKFVSRARVLA